MYPDVLVRLINLHKKVKAVRPARPVELVVGVKEESVALQVFRMKLANH